jgi:hypothetical protein
MLDFRSIFLWRRVSIDFIWDAKLAAVRAFGALSITFSLFRIGLNRLLTGFIGVFIFRYSFSIYLWALKSII